MAMTTAERMAKCRQRKKDKGKQSLTFMIETKTFEKIIEIGSQLLPADATQEDILNEALKHLLDPRISKNEFNLSSDGILNSDPHTKSQCLTLMNSGTTLEQLFDMIPDNESLPPDVRTRIKRRLRDWKYRLKQPKSS